MSDSIALRNKQLVTVVALCVINAYRSLHACLLHGEVRFMRVTVTHLCMFDSLVLLLSKPGNGCLVLGLRCVGQTFTSSEGVVHHACSKNKRTLFRNQHGSHGNETPDTITFPYMMKCQYDMVILL